jgi:hypothetical protein
MRRRQRLRIERLAARGGTSVETLAVEARLADLTTESRSDARGISIADPFSAFRSRSGPTLSDTPPSIGVLWV